MEKAKPIGAWLQAEGDELGGQNPCGPCGRPLWGLNCCLYLHIQHMYRRNTQQEVFASYPRCCLDFSRFSFTWAPIVAAKNPKTRDHSISVVIPVLWITASVGPPACRSRVWGSAGAGCLGPVGRLASPQCENLNDETNPMCKYIRVGKQTQSNRKLKHIRCERYFSTQAALSTTKLKHHLGV